MPAQAIFKLLPGTWQYIRSITNVRDAALSGEAIGQGIFTNTDQSELFYTELGCFTTKNGNQLKTSNAYFYVYNKSTNRLEKYFAIDLHTKGDLFYVLGSDKTAEHHCGQDIYKAHYELLAPSELVINYSVTGPRKNYTSRTVYTRI